jgi:hypothetical protein
MGPDGGTATPATNLMNLILHQLHWTTKEKLLRWTLMGDCNTI